MRPLCFVLLFFLLPLTVWSQKSTTITNSWADAKKYGKAGITVYWHESKPFIWKENGEFKGIEYELFIDFKKYLALNHNIDLTLNFIEAPSFADTYTLVRDHTQSGVMGASAFSITAERKRELNFTPSYMLDISVLISSKNVPVLTDTKQLDETIAGLTAITIKGTTYEADLLAIKRDRNIDFTIKYIPSIQNILRTIQDTTNAFGFIDLPVYLMYLNKDAGLKVNRQNLYPIKREGYALIYPKKSDWEAPLNEYFNAEETRAAVKIIISHYIDNEVYEFIQNLFRESNDNVMLLTHEKEVQMQELLGKTKQIETEATLRKYLLITLGFILIFLIVILLLYLKGKKTNKLLLEQKEEIEQQRISINTKNLELEENNFRLVQLNEEKNYLIKVLAHDLRAPINQVQGMARIFLLENKHLPPEQTYTIKEIIEASKRLNNMIGKILDIDAVENNRTNITLEKVDLCERVNKVVSSFQTNAEAKSIQLITNLAEKELWIKADVDYLTEIIENLISNAIKFSPYEKTITIATQANNASATLCIQDEGPGLTDADKEKLFQKFQQLSAKATGGEPSTGLGLSIVKKYTELMNGKVWYDSTAGKGARFCVEFPKHAD
jgi:signal transduction histidine kinase